MFMGGYGWRVIDRVICPGSLVWCRILLLSGEEAGVAGGAGEPVGSARLELVSGVALLREEDAVLEAMLAGDRKSVV